MTNLIYEVCLYFWELWLTIAYKIKEIYGSGVIIWNQTRHD